MSRSDAAPRGTAPRGAGPLRVRFAAVAADPRRGRKIAETVVFALLAPLVGTLAQPADPLGLGGGYPWVAALPVVLAARYGSVWGGACALLASLACLAHAERYASTPLALAALVVGMFVTVLMVGEIGLAWRRRAARAEAEAGYLQRRLQEFSNEHHVLKVSHGLLQESLAGRRMSLREALQRLERVVPEGGAAFGPGFAGNAELMAAFAQFCSVQVAGLYAMRSPTVIEPEPVAVHGAMEPLQVFDPLLRATIADGKMNAVRLDAYAVESDERALLAVVPIVDSGGRLHGVLAVREMHFMAFQRENLNLMALLGAWLGDRFGRVGGFSASPADHFLSELDAALQRVREFEVPAALVCVRAADHPDAAEALRFVARDIRSLDRAWPATAPDGAPVATVLLPLSSETDAEDYAGRMLGAVRDRFGVEPGRLVASLHLRALVPADTRASCLAFIAGATGQRGPGVRGGVELPLDGPDALRGVA